MILVVAKKDKEKSNCFILRKHFQTKCNVRSGIWTHASIRRPETPWQSKDSILESGALDHSAILTTGHLFNKILMTTNTVHLINQLRDFSTLNYIFDIIFCQQTTPIQCGMETNVHRWLNFEAFKDEILMKYSILKWNIYQCQNILRPGFEPAT